MDELTFYDGAYSGVQVDAAIARALAGGAIDQEIASLRAAVGSPLVANTVSEMTNTNRIYVYTGSEAGYNSGHWYYWNGSAWTDGGAYNSAAADDEMSDSSTNAVQNKVIKEYVDDVRTDLGSDIADARTDLGADILAEQTRAENVEALKAPLASPALTGTPTAPTAAAGTANTQIATTAYADNAVAVEKARAEAVEATKADKSYADYILLREEEDRQILFGSIVEAAEDTYDELRAAPIHNAITIGQSVYPRMDRTRMAIDAIRGRTVAFNQLATLIDSFNTYGGTKSVADNVLTMTLTSDANSAQIYRTINRPSDHVVLVSMQINPEKTTTVGFGLGNKNNQQSNTSCPANVWTTVYFLRKLVGNGTEMSAYINTETSLAVGDKVQATKPQYFDLTAEYGTVIADQINALEQATAGAGVAWVKQRLDLDYYAYNAGTLTAPVVSGVTVTGFNLWDEVWDVGRIVSSTGQNAGTEYDIRSRNYIPVFPNTLYCIANTNTVAIFFYDANEAFIGRSKSLNSGAPTFTTPSNCHFVRFCTLTSLNIGYNPSVNPICVNYSKTTGTPKNGDYLPYISTSLPIPSTRLDGVGTAQDVMYVREDGENDYSLIKRSAMELVDLGSLAWVYTSSGNRFTSAGISSTVKYPSSDSVMANIITPPLLAMSLTELRHSSADNLIAIGDTGSISVRHTASGTDAAAIKTAMSGKYLCYEKATPTETVIAEHLTLAEVSAIAENGGIISVENSNGHIVQPDVVMDTVISRSAS